MSLAALVLLIIVYLVLDDFVRSSPSSPVKRRATVYGRDDGTAPKG